MKRIKKVNRPISFVSLFLISASVFFQSALANDFPVVVQDDRNKKVVFDKKPVKVASVSNFGADLLTALGKQAVGISSLNHKQSAFLGTQVTKMVDLGEIHETNMELLTELDPDLTIGIRAYTEPYEKKFEEIGKFLAFDMVTYEDSIQAILSAGTALGERLQAKRLNEAFVATLQAHQKKAPGGVTAVFLWHWANVPYGYFDHHFTVHMMESLKVDNLIGTSPQPGVKKLDSAPVAMELLLKLDPDVIISFKGDDGHFQAHPVWNRLKAVRNGRAYRVADQYVMPHGPIARDMVLRELAYIFYPEKFARPNNIPAAAMVQPMIFTAD